MITKAYIQEVLTPYSVRVRIPLYHKIENVNGSTRQELLPIAYISAPPNVKIDPKVGDVVIVTFEEENLSKPIVIGYLYSNKDTTSTINIECENLTSTGETILGKNTLIGDIKYENIACLKNMTENISDSIRIMQSDISKEISNLKVSTDTSIESLMLRLVRLENLVSGLAINADE